MSEDKSKVKKRTVLSIDMGSTMGWALCQENKIVYSGTEAMHVKDAHPGHRFLTFHNWLMDFKGVDEVIYEIVGSFQNADSAKIYCGLLAVLQMFTLTHGIRLAGLHAMTVKKEFCGSGRAEKEEICSMCHALGWKNGKPGTRLDHDEADAIAVMFCVLARRGVQISF